MLVLINEYVSLFLILGLGPGTAFSCLENKTVHSKQNPLCPCVWPLLGEVRELGRQQSFWFWRWRRKKEERAWLQNCKEMAGFVALIALNSSNFWRAVVNPIYAIPHLSIIQIFLGRLVWIEEERSRYTILAKCYVPVELAARFLSHDVAHLTCVCCPLNQLFFTVLP